MIEYPAPRTTLKIDAYIDPEKVSAEDPPT